jgi:hypothetical protein
MAKAPKGDQPLCDVPGCGHLATMLTDGTEKDVAVKRTAPGVDEPLARKSLPNLNLCEKHTNWAFSDDAKAWVAAPSNAAKYAARAGA